MKQQSLADIHPTDLEILVSIKLTFQNHGAHLHLMKQRAGERITVEGFCDKGVPFFEVE